MAFGAPTLSGEPTYQLVLGTTADPIYRVFVNVRPTNMPTSEYGEQLVQKVIDALDSHVDLVFVEATKVAESTAYGKPTP